MTTEQDMTSGGHISIPDQPNSVTHPIINSPYEEPRRYWKLDNEHRATSEQVVGRRPSANLPAVPTPRLNEQLSLDQNQLVNDIREAVGAWRTAGYPGATANTKRLLTHWTNPLAMRRLFFAQVEALETLIWLTEVAPDVRPQGDVLSRVERASGDYNDGLFRMAVKMATGTGKTAAMGMVIAWHAVNAGSSRRNGRHADRYHTQFLAITPGLTVRERLAVLDPFAPNNVYAELDLVPAGLREHLNRVQVRRINRQAFQRRDVLGQNVTGDTRRLLRRSGARVLESPQAMLQRVLRGMPALTDRGGKIVVLNDEAHHCYLPGHDDGGKAEPLTEDTLSQDGEPAALWFNALRSLREADLLAEPVYDFSATPMFISTSMRRNAPMFPWCVSDFSLLDAIESGLVKIPRVPVEDDSDADSPVWRRLFHNTNPKTLHRGGLHGAIGSGLDALYRNYEETYEQWCGGSAERPMPTPPVLIAVAGNIGNAEAMHHYMAGYAEEGPDGKLVFQPGACPLFSNVLPDRSGWEPSLRTLLVHSKLDEEASITKGSKLGRALSTQAELLREMGDEALAGMDDQAVVREALNTVGKVGKLGEQIRCVVSVSMLTEGWDAKCTHILGYRAFSTQLLCEQVVGRALRRSSYDVGEDGLLPPEFAEVLGVPFDFLPPASRDIAPTPDPRPTYEVQTLPGRQSLRVDFPLIASYRFAEGSGSRRLAPGRVEPFELADAPTMAVMVGVAGTEEIVASGPDDVRRQRVEAGLASALVAAWERELMDAGESARRVFLFRNAVEDVRLWLAMPQVRGAAADGDVWRRLVTAEAQRQAVVAILDACVPGPGMAEGITAIFEQPELRSTHGIQYETSLGDHYPDSLDTFTEHSEINIAACHSGLEVEIARLLDAHPHVTAWARNYGLGWTLPYLYDGVWRRYEPDFVARLFGGRESELPVFQSTPNAALLVGGSSASAGRTVGASTHLGGRSASF